MMRWLTFPLRRDADVLSARSRLRAFADATGLAGLAHTQLVTAFTELSRLAVVDRDGAIEFGWDPAIDRPFCAIELPAAVEIPKEISALPGAGPHEGAERPDAAARFAVETSGDRCRHRCVADLRCRADDVRRAVEAFEATLESAKEQDLEIARMLAAARDREEDLVRALDDARRRESEATAQALRLQDLSKKKDELLAIASHDIRSPVAAGRGALELLEPTLPGLTDDQKHLIGVARRAADSVTHLLGNLLSTALLERGDDDDEPPLPVVDVVPIAREVLEQMEIQARHKGTALEVSWPDGPLTVRGDVMWIRQVVGNVVNNALKFTPKGGHVAVRLSRSEGAVLLVVDDDGVGVPADKADRVFEKLVKLRPRGTAGERGTGIGLYVTKQLVDRLGGAIRLQPRAPAGTRFEVQIPWAEGPPIALAGSVV
jgi:signal transduction histidine kinase